MAADRVTIDELADAVADIMADVKDICAEQLKETVIQAGKDTAKEIKATAPKKTGKYAKSWRSRTTKETADGLQVTVYSPSRYMLAHLLEFGHAKRGGGRVEGIEHIGPAGDKVLGKAEEKLARSITHEL